MNHTPFFKPPEPPVPPLFPFLLSDGHIPVGAIMAFAGLLSDSDKGPRNNVLLEKSGWALCDGRQLEVDKYPELFEAIGYVYGGTGYTFNLPDYGGYFLRGAPVSAGSKKRDPDAKEREFNMSGGGASEDAGSTQEDALQKHEHKYDALLKFMVPSKEGGPGLGTSSDTCETKEICDANVSTETRPKNMYVHFIIKCK